MTPAFAFLLVLGVSAVVSGCSVESRDEEERCYDLALDAGQAQCDDRSAALGRFQSVPDPCGPKVQRVVGGPAAVDAGSTRACCYLIELLDDTQGLPFCP